MDEETWPVAMTRRGLHSMSDNTGRARGTVHAIKGDFFFFFFFFLRERSESRKSVLFFSAFINFFLEKLIVHSKIGQISHAAAEKTLTTREKRGAPGAAGLFNQSIECKRSERGRWRW